MTTFEALVSMDLSFLINLNEEKDRQKPETRLLKCNATSDALIQKYRCTIGHCRMQSIALPCAVRSPLGRLRVQNAGGRTAVKEGKGAGPPSSQLEAEASLQVHGRGDERPGNPDNAAPGSRIPAARAGRLAASDMSNCHRESMAIPKGGGVFSLSE